MNKISTLLAAASALAEPSWQPTKHLSPAGFQTGSPGVKARRKTRKAQKKARRANRRAK